MRKNQRYVIAISILIVLSVGVVAQEQSPEAQDRIITIDWSGGTQKSPDLRYGPIEFNHEQPEGIVGTVDNITIFSQNARLAAPDKTLIAESQGKRTATFYLGVRLIRGRLEAVGPRIEYSEQTGSGVLSGDAHILIKPLQEEDEKITISTTLVEFDVDTDRSFSSGGVELINGDQTANSQELLFADEQGLGHLTGIPQPKIHRFAENGDELLIIADEIRILTNLKLLHAIGTVTVVEGSITTHGKEVFFDDSLEIAEVIGDPAVAVDEANGLRLEADRIRQDIQFDFVEQILATDPNMFDPKLFLFWEKSGGINEEAYSIPINPDESQSGNQVEENTGD